MTVLSLSESQELQWDIFTKQITDKMIFQYSATEFDGDLEMLPLI